MHWIIPLPLVAPAVPIGYYALGVTDICVLLWGAFAFMGGKLRSPRGSPMMAYMALYFMGWLLATANGPRFGVNAEWADFVIGYRLAFHLLAWSMGYMAFTSVERAATSRPALLLMSAAAGLVVLYTVLPHSQRIELMAQLAPNWSREELAGVCRKSRFPGIGQNPNIYTFFPLCIFLFSLQRFVKGESSPLIPALAMITITSAASRKTVATAAVAALIICLFRSRALYPRIVAGIRRPSKPTARLVAILAVLAIGGIVLGLASRGYLSDRFRAKYAEGDNTEDFLYRLRKWRVGMQRVSMAPVLGLPRPSSSDRRGLPYLIRMSSPHNEFIQIWMWYGVAGLVAHLYLFGSLISRNLRQKTDPVWLVFYVAVIIQMLVDTALKDYQVSAVFFAVAGNNWRMLSERRGPPIPKPPGGSSGWQRAQRSPERLAPLCRQASASHRHAAPLHQPKSRFHQRPPA